MGGAHSLKTFEKIQFNNFSRLLLTDIFLLQPIAVEDIVNWSRFWIVHFNAKVHSSNTTYFSISNQFNLSEHA